MNNISTPKILEAWITPDPSEAVRIDFDQLIANVEHVEAVKFGSQKLRRDMWNQYYNRETRLSTISLHDAYILMKDKNPEAVYFIMPDIRVLLANEDRFTKLMNHMNSYQFKNSYIITYHRHFSMQEIWTLFDNYKTALRYSAKDLLELRGGTASDQQRFRFYHHNVINLSDVILEDKRENEVDFEYYGHCDIMHYFYIYKLVALREDLINAVNSGGKNHVY